MKQVFSNTRLFLSGFLYREPLDCDCFVIHFAWTKVFSAKNPKYISQMVPFHLHSLFFGHFTNGALNLKSTLVIIWRQILCNFTFKISLTHSHRLQYRVTSFHYAPPNWYNLGAQQSTRFAANWSQQNRRCRTASATAQNSKRVMRAYAQWTTRLYLLWKTS